MKWLELNENNNHEKRNSFCVQFKSGICMQYSGEMDTIYGTAFGVDVIYLIWDSPTEITANDPQKYQQIHQHYPNNITKM